MDIRIPDIGDFRDVPVIEVHVAPGDVVAPEDPVITLESDKATMDIPAPAAGTVGEVIVRVGDRVCEGDLIMRLEDQPASASPASPARERIAGDAAPVPVDPPAYGSQSGVYEVIEVAVPDIGDFADVPVIEVHVGAGDEVAAEDPLITLESDKATMEIPAPVAGTVAGVRIAVGDRVSAGHIILDLRTGEKLEPESAAPAAPAASAARAPAPARGPGRAQGEVTAEVLVLGAGPGGYSAAFRAADLGKKVVMVDRWPDTRRGLPQCRLHPVQGPPARRQGHRRDQGDERARCRVQHAWDRR